MQRIAWSRTDPDLEVEMGTGRIAAAPHASDALATGDRVARRDEVLGVVRVDRDEAAVVSDEDEVPIAALEPGEEHFSGLRRENGRSLRCGEIDSFVLLGVAHPERGHEHAVQWPGEGRAVRRGVERTLFRSRNLRGLRPAETRFDVRFGGHLDRPLGPGNEDERPRRDLRRIGDPVLDADLVGADAVGPADGEEGLALAHLVEHTAMDVVRALRPFLRRIELGPLLLCRPGRRTSEGEHQAGGARPGSSHPFSSSTRAWRVRSRWSGVTEMSLRSKTASQSLPGTFSWDCSSPPIQ